MAPNLTSVLSHLRAPIFNTLPVSSNVRTGTKYLRRRLKGPAAVAYNPKPISLPTLNRDVMWNKYAGWDGKAAPGEPGSYHQLPEQQVVGPECEEVERRLKPGPPLKHGQIGKLAGWIEDGREWYRFEDVARRKKLGKGPPKKGEGRRSQMKKKK